MKLSRKNLFARYYNWIYGDYPNDLCSFFWGSLFAIVLFPICVSGRIFEIKTGHEYDNEPFKAGFGLLLLYFLVSLIGSGIGLTVILGYKIKEVWEFFVWGFLVGSVLLTVAILLIIGIFKGIKHLSDKSYEKRLKELENPQPYKPTLIDNTQDFVGAIRGKYCVTITLKD